MIHQFTLYTRLYSNKIYYLLRLLILQQIMEEKLMPLYTYNIYLLQFLYHGHGPYLAHCCKQDNMVAIVSVGSIWLFIWGWFSFLDMPPINWGHRRFRKFTHVWINGSYKKTNLQCTIHGFTQLMKQKCDTHWYKCLYFRLETGFNLLHALLFYQKATCLALDILFWMPNKPGQSQRQMGLHLTTLIMPV